MKKLVYTISILLIVCSTFAQDLTDALRFSNYHMRGTARSAAMGNAFGALGGDFSSLSINPAGAGVYRSGEFTITPSFGQTNIDGTYRGTTVSDSKYNLGLDNLGFISTYPTGDNSESGLVSINFGVGFNKLGSFSMNSLAEGYNSNHSLLTYFTDYANSSGTSSNNLDPYYERLAWDTDLLLFDEDNREYFNDISDAGYGQSQRSLIDRRGYINEYVLSVAANFNHKFYLGATLGIHDVYFKENADLYEWDANNDIPYFNNFNFNTYLKQSGTGVNFKIGAIYKPVEQLRLGVAFHTPTFYKFTEVYDGGMKSSMTYEEEGVVETTAYPDKEGTFDYEIQTPMKAIFSGALVLGKSGLISVDYELVDYSTLKIKNGSGGENYFEANADIARAYKAVGNLHVGGEYRLNKNFSLRGGYEYFPSAYKATYRDEVNPNTDASYSTFSGGFGFRAGSVFFDAAYKHVLDTENVKLYPGAINMAKYETQQSNVIFTLGYKF